MMGKGEKGRGGKRAEGRVFLFTSFTISFAIPYHLDGLAGLDSHAAVSRPSKAPRCPQPSSLALPSQSVQDSMAPDPGVTGLS